MFLNFYYFHDIGETFIKHKSANVIEWHLAALWKMLQKRYVLAGMFALDNVSWYHVPQTPGRHENMQNFTHHSSTETWAESQPCAACGELCSKYTAQNI